MATITTSARSNPTRMPTLLPPLSPTQGSAFDTLLAIVNALPVCAIVGEPGSGKTTILRHLHEHVGGYLLEAKEVLEVLGGLHPRAVEEGIFRIVEDAFKRSDLVIFDGIGGFEKTAAAGFGYSRPMLFDALEKALIENTRKRGKHIVFSRYSRGFDTITSQAVSVTLDDFTIEDYREILGYWLGAENISHADIESLHRINGKLTGYQLRSICALLQEQGITRPSTEQIQQTIDTYVLTSNFDVHEVEAVQHGQLKGIEPIMKQLETFITLPMLQPEVAKEFNIQPKRGVLLYGPPGTGKTSIGRLLAHRMQGKFFLIDGSAVSDTAHFYTSVVRTFAQATANSPAVIFIDDADVLFKAESVYGFNRFLLTKLDGLENETSGHICVMMTAMDVNDIPMAILRSGRVEVWLEAKLPDSATRAEILTHYAGEIAVEDTAFHAHTIAELAQGFTPADLRRVVGDAKAQLGFDLHKQRTLRSFHEYLEEAVTTLRSLRNNLARVTDQPLPFPEH